MPLSKPIKTFSFDDRLECVGATYFLCIWTLLPNPRLTLSRLVCSDTCDLEYQSWFTHVKYGRSLHKCCCLSDFIVNGNHYINVYYDFFCMTKKVLHYKFVMAGWKNCQIYVHFKIHYFTFYIIFRLRPIFRGVQTFSRRLCDKANIIFIHKCIFAYNYYENIWRCLRLLLIIILYVSVLLYVSWEFSAKKLPNAVIFYFWFPTEDHHRHIILRKLSYAAYNVRCEHIWFIVESLIKLNLLNDRATCRLTSIVGKN